MNKALKVVMALTAALCVATAAYGDPGKKDDQDAEVRFGIKLTAALNNDREAQYEVAEMYEQGVGTPQNLRMAHLWYSKAAKQGYPPAIEKIENWEKGRQESEQRARERAAAEEQKRLQAEAAAAAKAREEAAAKAARERAAAEEQKRQQAEAAAAAKAREEAAAKAREEAAKSAKAAEPAPAARTAPAAAPKDKPADATAKSEEKSAEEFRANPCKGPTAKFMSICQ